MRVSSATGSDFPGQSGSDELPSRLDAQQFARAQGEMSGKVAVRLLERLAAECTSTGAAVQWWLSGSVDGDGACWLTLRARAPLKMQCQRCLDDVDVDVLSVSRFRLVLAGEAWGDEDLEDDSFEALEVDGPLDVGALVEDEALLALPAIALHDQCEMPDAPDDTQEKNGNTGRPSPFAVLGKLKRT